MTRIVLQIDGPGFFTSFVGRRDLLTDVRERLSRSRVVSLVGPGGVGKTRLALRVVDLVRQARTFPDGICVASLDDLVAGDLLASAVADTIGVQIPDTSVGTEALIDFIGDRQALLVLDNCEHLYREVGELVTSLRAACPHLHVLLTSRRPLVISGEDVVTVPALSSPDGNFASETDPQTLRHYEAVQLFVERAQAASSGFELTNENARAVAQLCAELAGNPLALELAASRARVFTPQEILDRLHDPFRVLNVGYQDAPDRHRSLLTCVEWSHSLCSDAEQRLWERVWVFKGGFTLESAADVCANECRSEEPGEPPLVDLVGALVDQSVLLAEAGPDGTMRYRMLPDIREYGRRSARAAGHESELRERHVLWCRRLTDRFDAASSGPDQESWLVRMEAELPNIRAALQHAASTPGLVEEGLRILVDLDLFWAGLGHLGEVQTWHDALLVHGEGSRVVRARASAATARFAVFRGDRVVAREHLRRAEQLGGDDPVTRGRSLIATAVLRSWNGETEASLADIDRAVELFGTTGDRNGLLLAYVMSGVLRNRAGDRRGAEESWSTCIATAEKTGEQWMRAFALNGLGDLALAAGELDRAEDLYRQALIIKHRLRDRTGVAVCLDALGRVASQRGRARRAALLLGAAERVWRVLGMSHTGNVLTHTGAREPALDPVRKALGEREFADQFARGSRLEVAHAIGFALDPGLDDPRAIVTGESETSPLTKRELEVADLVAEGLSNPEIAARLVISVRTAQGHVENSLRKLGFNSRSQIAAWVAERRLGDPPA